MNTILYIIVVQISGYKSIHQYNRQTKNITTGLLIRWCIDAFLK